MFLLEDSSLDLRYTAFEVRSNLAELICKHTSTCGMSSPGITKSRGIGFEERMRGV